MYCTTEEQLTLAKASKESYEKSLGRPITTEIVGPAQSVKFWPAEVGEFNSLSTRVIVSFCIFRGLTS